MDTKKPRSKLTIQIWDRLFNLLEQRTAEICQRRDALLERVIANEIDHLRDDLPVANSEAARAHIEHHLKLLLSGSKRQITLSLSPDTATRLDEVCTEKNVPREAFLNRVILFLVAKPTFLDAALFGLKPDVAHEMRTDIKNQYSVNLELENGFAPLPMIADILADPFWGYRAMAAEVSTDAGGDYTLYGMPFGQKNFLGLNCFVADAEVPGTDAYLAAQQEADQMLAELGGEVLQLKSASETSPTTKGE